MRFLHGWRTARPQRVVAISSLLIGIALVPGSAFAQSAPGTLVGSVTCGPTETAPAANALVRIEEMDLSTHADAAGTFKLTGVPSGHIFTVDAVSDPSASFVTTRYNVAAEPGAIVNIGVLDLGACPQATTDTTQNQDQPVDNQEDMQ